MDQFIYAFLGFLFVGIVNSQGRLQAPTFALSSSASDSFDIQFTPMSVAEWRIQYREAGQKKKQLEIDGSHTEYRVEGLKTSTEYKVRVMGTSPGVKGQYSAWFGVTTASNQPQPQPEPEPEVTATIPDLPSRIAVDARDTTARLSWDPPIDNGAEVIGYVVQYGTSDNPTENVYTLRPEPTYSDLDGLTPNTPYEVSITAYNSNGQSYPATLAFQTTGGGVEEPVPSNMPPQPQNVRYESISPTVIRVTWTLPETTVANEIENVRFGFGDEGIPVEYLSSSNLGVGITSYTAEQLRPGSRYTIMVLTENRFGQSEPVVLTVETIPMPAPATHATPEQECPFPVLDCANQYEGRLVNVDPKDPHFCAIVTHYSNCLFSVPAKLQTYSCFEILAVQLTRANEFCSGPVRKTWSPSPVSPPVTQQVVVPPPTQVIAEVISPTSVRLSFVDPSFGSTQDTTTDRYYAIRYKRDSDAQFQSIQSRDTTYIVEYLTPETNYQIDVATVLGPDFQSEFVTVYVYTVDLSRGDLVRQVTAIQVKVTNPGLLSAVINWIPPQNQRSQIRGYVVEYTSGDYVTPGSSWERIDMNNFIPSATVQPLMANTTYHVRVAPRFGNSIGDFSSPPQLFLTPTVPPSGQPLHVCSTSETPEQVIERVQWMRDGGGLIARPALVGVPLPYCDDYYGIHECHGLVCFCIPGKRPQSDAACRSGGYQGDQPNPGFQGDQPEPLSLDTPPCRAEYEAGRRQISEARKAGKTLYGVNLPYCTDEGYYYKEQCVGSVCFCSTLDGDHIGKEVPLWEADSLDCCK